MPRAARTRVRKWGTSNSNSDQGNSHIQPLAQCAAEVKSLVASSCGWKRDEVSGPMPGGRPGADPGKVIIEVPD